jgi:hypothetical protein
MACAPAAPPLAVVLGAAEVPVGALATLLALFAVAALLPASWLRNAVRNVLMLL